MEARRTFLPSTRGRPAPAPSSSTARDARSPWLRNPSRRATRARAGWSTTRLEIWSTQLAAAREAIAQARISPSRIAGIGIANQRETAVFWDRSTGAPLGPAIVWQDRRTADICRTLSARGLERMIVETHGSSPRSLFLGDEDHVGPGKHAGHAEEGAGGGRLLRHGGLVARAHADGKPPHRSVERLADPPLRHPQGRVGHGDPFRPGNPRGRCCPRRPFLRSFGHAAGSLLGAEIPVCGVLGDQQAALLGQACLEPGAVKVTYGTGCFCLLSTGRQPLRPATGFSPPSHGTWATAWSTRWRAPCSSAARWCSGCATSCASSPPPRSPTPWPARFPTPAGSTSFPPSSGMGAPHWDPEVRGRALRHHPRHAAGAHRARRPGEHRLPDP